MALVNSRGLLRDARANGYAVGAFNVENMEMMQAVIAAAEAEHAPVILQTTPSTLKYAEPAVFAAMAVLWPARRLCQWLCTWITETGLDYVSRPRQTVIPP